MSSKKKTNTTNKSIKSTDIPPASELGRQLMWEQIMQGPGTDESKRRAYADYLDSIRGQFAQSRRFRRGGH